MDRHGPHMGAHGSHMGEHGPHLGWKFFEKHSWAKYPMGINRSRIPHYF
jgi:hypothetical protein